MVDGLRRLEYRGYDSAGVAVVTGPGELAVERKAGRLANLESKVGGGTPTRDSVYKLPEVEKAKKPPSKMPNILTADAVFEAWKPENIGLRPKIAAWNECDTAIFTQLSKMLAGQQGPEKCMTNSKDGFVQAIDNAASLRSA